MSSRILGSKRNSWCSSCIWQVMRYGCGLCMADSDCICVVWWSLSVAAAVVVYLFIVAVSAWLARFLILIAVICAYNMQCHARLWCHFLYPDQDTVLLRMLYHSSYNGCPLSWWGGSIGLSSKFWPPSSSALRPWLRKVCRLSILFCCPSCIYFLWVQRPLRWCFQVGQQNRLTICCRTILDPKLD